MNRYHNESKRKIILLNINIKNSEQRQAQDRLQPWWQGKASCCCCTVGTLYVPNSVQRKTIGSDRYTSKSIDINQNRCSGVIYDTNSLLNLLEYSICVYCALGVLTKWWSMTITTQVLYILGMAIGFDWHQSDSIDYNRIRWILVEIDWSWSKSIDYNRIRLIVLYGESVTGTKHNNIDIPANRILERQFIFNWFASFASFHMTTLRSVKQRVKIASFIITIILSKRIGIGVDIPLKYRLPPLVGFCYTQIGVDNCFTPPSPPMVTVQSKGTMAMVPMS